MCVHAGGQADVCGRAGRLVRAHVHATTCVLDARTELRILRGVVNLSVGGKRWRRRQFWRGGGGGGRRGRLLWRRCGRLHLVDEHCRRRALGTRLQQLLPCCRALGALLGARLRKPLLPLTGWGQRVFAPESRSAANKAAAFAGRVLRAQARDTATMWLGFRAWAARQLRKMERKLAAAHAPWPELLNFGRAEKGRLPYRRDLEPL